MREREENDLSSRSDIFKFVKTGMLGSYECDLAVERERRGGGERDFLVSPAQYFWHAFTTESCQFSTLFSSRYDINTWGDQYTRF